jgi:hypothetical protein
LTGNPPISLIDAPGVAHVLFRSQKKPFALLHAKIALLGFRHNDKPDKWAVRLIVSTGNWTTQTLEESLDLAWCIDIYSDEVQGSEEEVSLRSADINAARSLLIMLMNHYDLDILEISDHGHLSDTADARRLLDAWLDQCAKNTQGTTPRFFDTQRESLLKQLPGKIKKHAAISRRNYLAMGSGFYESALTQSKGANVPKVLEDIVTLLTDEGLLTNTPQIDVFVNPAACQVIAQSVSALTNKGYVVRPAGQPKALFGERQQRTLHAKFLFGANYRDDSNNCSSPWIYLGSGNLTGPGFIHNMHPKKGNLEAGVVFSPSSLQWNKQGDGWQEMIVTTLLPIQWNEEIQSDNVLAAGGDMPERTDQYLAPPIAWLEWYGEGSSGEIRVPDNNTYGFDILDLEPPASE